MVTEPRIWNVSGMSCQHCIAAITDEVGIVDGVRAVDVNLDAGTVAVVGGDPVAIEAAIDEAGYDVSTPTR